MRAVAFVSRKGGSGKSTLATHLAIGAALRGRNVLLADTDPQRSAYDVIRLRHDGSGPGSLRCEPSTGAKLFALKTNAERSKIDLLIVDTPAGNDEVIAQALAACDSAVVVVRPSFLDFSGAARTAEVAKCLRKPAFAIVNQAPAARDGAENGPVRSAMKALELIKIPIFPLVVRYRVAYQTALAQGLSVEEVATSGPARVEMTSLADMTDHIWFPRPWKRPDEVQDHALSPALHAAE